MRSVFLFTLIGGRLEPWGLLRNVRFGVTKDCCEGMAVHFVPKPITSLTDAPCPLAINCPSLYLSFHFRNALFLLPLHYTHVCSLSILLQFLPFLNFPLFFIFVLLAVYFLRIIFLISVLILVVYFILFFHLLISLCDFLCGLVVRVLGYRSGGPGSIPGTTRKKHSGSGTESTQPRE
jgi:hypothetical protein